MIVLLFMKNQPHIYHSRVINSTLIAQVKRKKSCILYGLSYCMLILDANFLQSKDPQSSGARCCDSPKNIWLRKEASLDVSFYLC